MMKQDKSSPSDIRRHRRIARDIVRSNFGKEASRIVYKSTGLTNFVFAINHAEGQFVIRISDQLDRLPIYQKELWATQRVRSLGIPTYEILKVGTVDSGEPFMISRRVSGTEATHHPKRLGVIHDMGDFARQINSIPTNNFGESFDWHEPAINNRSWSDYLDNEWQVEERLTFLGESEFISKERVARLRSTIDEAKTMSVTPRLSHGDLRLKNVIVDEDGEITAIIDWEECLSTYASPWELSITLHDLSIDEKHAFLEGYGLNNEELIAMSPLVRTFNILNYVPAIKGAIEENDETKIQLLKLRLSGSLDLYCI